MQKTYPLLDKIAAITAIAIAGILAFTERPDWGWFLGVGFLLHLVSMSQKVDKKVKKADGGGYRVKG